MCARALVSLYLCCVVPRAYERVCGRVSVRARAHASVRTHTGVCVCARACVPTRARALGMRCGFAGESGLDALPGLALGLVAPPAAPHCSHARARARSRHRLDRYDKATGKELIGIRSFSMLNRSISAGNATAALTSAATRIHIRYHRHAPRSVRFVRCLTADSMKGD